MTPACRTLALLRTVVADTAQVGREKLRGRDHGIAPGALADCISWLCRTHDVTGRRGSSKCFSLLHGWAPAYPETTGYVIGTLLDYGRAHGSDDLIVRAKEMGDWEVEVQNPDGGVMEGEYSDPPRSSVVFNTGMVIHGWLDLADALGEVEYLEPAGRAGDFLVAAQDDDGAWRGAGQYSGIPHAYDSRVAWALVRLASATGDDRYRTTAVRALDWTVAQQDEDGWLANCFFKPGMLPSTHSLAYTLRGLLESHALLDHPRYLRAAIATADVLVRKQEQLGFLPGAFAPGWRPGGRYECLTGTAQLGGVWLRLHQLDGGDRFLSAGLKALDRAAALQARGPSDDVRGALAGSFPVYGRYAPLQYPNWGTKFLADGLMLRERIGAIPAERSVGPRTSASAG